MLCLSFSQCFPSKMERNSSGQQCEEMVCACHESGQTPQAFGQGDTAAVLGAIG